MGWGWILKEKYEADMARQKADFERRLKRANEAHQEEIDGLRKAIAQANILKSRGKMPGELDDRYTIQVFADAKLLHSMVRGNRKNLVRILAQQFAYEAERMLLALSALDRIPILPVSSDPVLKDWWKTEERG